MNKTISGSVSRSFSYPGTFRDYSRQAWRISGVFGGMLGLIVLSVLAFDRFFYGGTRLTWWHITGVCILFAGFSVIAQLMARSLTRFRITADDNGLTVTRTGTESFVSYGEISGVDRVRVPGWWPLRADLKPRRETARRMILIKRGQAPPVTFISGLEGEDELIAKVTRSAGAGDGK